MLLFIEKVRAMQEKKPSIVIAVSEGVKLEDGRYVCELADDVHAVDAFGQPERRPVCLDLQPGVQRQLHAARDPADHGGRRSALPCGSADL